MATGFDRDALLDAFDEIGRAAVAAGTKLQMQVDGDSALMLASNFRFATEDVDIADIGGDWPEWLSDVVARIARENGWSEDWFNDGVAFHLSALATAAQDHLEFGTFPRDASQRGRVVSVPSAEYLLALKLKAMRVTDPIRIRGDTERLDILKLMEVVGVEGAAQAIAVRGKYFPVSAASSEKQRLLLNNMNRGGKSDAPNTLADAVARIHAGGAQDVAMAEFVDRFDVAPTPDARYACIADEPVLGEDAQLNALVGAMAEYLAKQHRLGRVPAWTSGQRRRLDQPWFTTASPTDAMREYLTFASPAEFASRNIFTGERPLRRARSPLAV